MRLYKNCEGWRWQVVIQTARGISKRKSCKGKLLVRIGGIFNSDGKKESKKIVYQLKTCEAHKCTLYAIVRWET